MDRRTVLQGIGGITLFTLAGADPAGADEDDGDEEPGTARLRVAHASPDAPDVDVFARPVDEETAEFTKLLSDVSFGTVSAYLEVAATEYEVKIAPAGAGSENAVLTSELDLEMGTDVTAAAIGEVFSDDTAFELLALEDDNGALDTDTARVRLVHASPDAPAVDVTVNDGGLTLFDGVAFGESGGYVEVPATTEGTKYEVEVRPDSEDNDADPVFEQDLTVSGGEVYTVFAEGYLSPEDESVDNPMERTFQLIVTNDASPPPATVTFEDQTVDPAGGTAEVEVASTALSEGGFIVIHNEALLDGQVVESIIGNSEFLEPGTSTGIEIEVPIDGIVSESRDGSPVLIAMAHRDTDGDEEYGFPGEDGPYVDPDDTNGDGTNVVIDTAAITLGEEEEDEEEEEEEEREEDEEEEEEEEREEEERGDPDRDDNADEANDETGRGGGSDQRRDD